MLRKTLPLMIAIALVAVPTACGRKKDRSANPVATFAEGQAWDQTQNDSAWNAAMLSSLQAQGDGLVNTVPSDITRYCPGYTKANTEQRRHFWAGVMRIAKQVDKDNNPLAQPAVKQVTGLASYSSRANADSGCTDTTGNGACAMRIMSDHIIQDGALFGDVSSGWRGLARQWMPFRSKAVQNDVTNWAMGQKYCR